MWELNQKYNYFIAFNIKIIKTLTLFLKLFLACGTFSKLNCSENLLNLKSGEKLSVDSKQLKS